MHWAGHMGFDIAAAPNGTPCPTRSQLRILPRQIHLFGEQVFKYIRLQEPFLFKLPQGLRAWFFKGYHTSTNGSLFWLICLDYVSFGLLCMDLLIMHLLAPPHTLEVDFFSSLRVSWNVFCSYSPLSPNSF